MTRRMTRRAVHLRFNGRMVCSPKKVGLSVGREGRLELVTCERCRQKVAELLASGDETLAACVSRRVGRLSGAVRS